MAWDLASVKRWLGISGTSDDADIQALMDRALDAVQRELDWWFDQPRAAEEILDGTGNRELWIRQPDAGSSLKVYDRAGVGETWDLYSADDYESDGRGLFNIANWTRGVRNYRVTYEEGFTTMPGDIEQLLLDLVSAKWKSRTTNPEMKGERIGDYAYTRGDLEDSEHWNAVIGRWRRGRI